MVTEPQGVSGSRHYLGWTSGLNHFCETGNTEDIGQTPAPAQGTQNLTKYSIKLLMQDLSVEPLREAPVSSHSPSKASSTSKLQHLRNGYQIISLRACTKEQSVNGKPWCAVKVDYIAMWTATAHTRVSSCLALAPMPAPAVFPVYLCTQVSLSGTVLTGQWGDCSHGCPVTGGGSKLGLCTARCGDTQPQV